MAQQRNIINGIPLATPLIKWVGGKQRLAPRIAALIAPALANADTYHEPFVGAGGFLLHLLSTGALLGKKVIASDTNRRLIEFHTVVQEAPEELIADLREFKYCGGADAYRDLRNEYNSNIAGTARAHRAAVFYVLMHKCYNGLYRENSRGGFNAAIGLPNGAAAFELTDSAEAAIRNVSRATAGVTFIAQDCLEAVESAAGARSFIYADPPYEATFGRYSAARYSAAALFIAIAKSGTAAAISNSDNARPLARDLLTTCDIYDFDIKYSIGKTAKSRGNKVEILIQVAPITTPPVALTDSEVDAILGIY